MIEQHKTVTVNKLIKMLNPIIRGWCNYHRKVISSRIFVKLDSEIFRKLWSWVKRRHLDKITKWIKAKYFGSFKRRNWVFFAKENERIINLFSTQSTKIVRHLKIRNNANPFDAIGMNIL